MHVYLPSGYVFIHVSVDFCYCYKMPNSNDAMFVTKNVHLTTMGAQQCSMTPIYPSYRKADLPATRDDNMIIRKVCADGNKLSPGKEWRLYA